MIPGLHGGLYRDGTVSGLVLDVLETYCGAWFTDDDVVTMCLDVRPGTNPNAVRRSLERMIQRGHVHIGDNPRKVNPYTQKPQRMVMRPWRWYWHWIPQEEQAW